MTKIYTTSQLESNRDNKDLSELRAEYNNFKKENNRSVEVIYHDEQLPIPTTYDLVQPGAEDTPPKWIGGGSLSIKWEKLLGTNQLSVRNTRWKGDPEPVKVVSGGGKVWRSQTDTKLTMGVMPVRIEGKYDMDNPAYEYLWRHYDDEAMLSDTGRRIDLTWGSKWTTVFGSKPSRDMWQEELRNKKVKFYEDHESENFDLKTGKWQDVVEAHLDYFSEIITSIMRGHRDSLPVDEATSIAMLAISEFADKMSKTDDPLNARFATAAYSWVRNYYRDALDEKETINTKSRQNMEDFRTLTTLLKELNSQLDHVTIEDICRTSGFGERRVNTAMKIFDFNAGGYREPNDDELLYKVMNEHLTERQATIVEMSFGLADTDKYTIPEIAEDLNVNEKTIRRDREKAMLVIKDKLGFKYNQK